MIFVNESVCFSFYHYHHIIQYDLISMRRYVYAVLADIHLHKLKPLYVLTTKYTFKNDGSLLPSVVP